MCVLTVPQALAYATIAGLPPAMGLYAAAVPAIVGSLFRSSRHVITGPTNALSLLVGAAVATGLGGDPVGVALTLALMVGVMQVAAGVLRLGSLVDYISGPVVLGYITGAGVLIGVGQLHNATGTTGSGRLAADHRAGLAARGGARVGHGGGDHGGHHRGHLRHAGAGQAPRSTLPRGDHGDARGAGGQPRLRPRGTGSAGHLRSVADPPRAAVAHPARSVDDGHAAARRGRVHRVVAGRVQRGGPGHRLAHGSAPRRLHRVLRPGARQRGRGAVGRLPDQRQPGPHRPQRAARCAHATGGDRQRRADARGARRSGLAARSHPHREPRGAAARGRLGSARPHPHPPDPACLPGRCPRLRGHHPRHLDPVARHGDLSRRRGQRGAVPATRPGADPARDDRRRPGTLAGVSARPGLRPRAAAGRPRAAGGGSAVLRRQRGSWSPRSTPCSTPRRSTRPC